MVKKRATERPNEDESSMQTEDNVQPTTEQLQENDQQVTETEYQEEGEELSDEDSFQGAAKEDQFLTLKLSGSLLRKLQYKAQNEGVTAGELATELIAEGVMLRAWEVMERKSVMNGNHPQQNRGFGQQRHNNNNNHQNRNQRPNNRRGGLSNDQYNQIMDDKAAFLEYVRQQEKKQRR